MQKPNKIGIRAEEVNPWTIRGYAVKYQIFRKDNLIRVDFKHKTTRIEPPKEWPTCCVEEEGIHVGKGDAKRCPCGVKL